MWFTAAIANSDDPILDSDVPAGLSAGAIERLLADQPTFTTEGLRRLAAKWAERTRALPMMAIGFHRHLDESGTIPTFEEYMRDYEVENRDTIASIGGMDGIRHRVARAYPSLVRDVHFVASVRECGVPARRTLRMDLSGVDAIVGTGEGGTAAMLTHAISNPAAAGRVPSMGSTTRISSGSASCSLAALGFARSRVLGRLAS